MKEIAIKKFGTAFNGKTPSKTEQRSEGIPILKIKDIDEDGQFRGSFGSFVDPAFGEKYSNKRLRAGDTIILNAAHNRDYVGSKSAFVKKELNGVLATGEWLVVRINAADPAYVNYFLKSPLGRLSLKRYVKGIHLYPKDVERIKVPLPSPDKQRRISYLLGKVEGMIAKRKQHIQQLDVLIESVFLNMFGDPIKNEKEWKTVPFNKIGEFSSGGTPSKSRDDFWAGNFPWVSPKDMKVPRINDSIDHISEAVFEETSLKRIAPNHLVIVVRGMILAHSFPTAINTVEVSINQDMKAIKPIRGINVIYLQYGLNALKRQILKLVTVAGHGTRRFDSNAMRRLLIPKPPIEFQNQFVTFVEKIEKVKHRYQKSLTDLERLYQAISQKAFKDELDLSRIPLDLESIETIEDANITYTQQQTAEPVILSAPPVINKLTLSESQDEFIKQWLLVWLDLLNDEPFSSNLFMLATQQRLSELAEDKPIEIGIKEYEQVRDFLFSTIQRGQLKQTLNKIALHNKQESGNRVVLNKASQR